MIARDLDAEPASFRDMGPKRNPLGPDSPIAIRVRLLRRALGYEEATAFARFLDVPRTRLANVEGGHPLSSDLATRIKQRTGGQSGLALRRRYCRHAAQALTRHSGGRTGFPKGNHGQALIALSPIPTTTEKVIHNFIGVSQYGGGSCRIVRQL